MRNPVERKEENAVELESQFILRMPSEPAKILRDLIRSGVTNFKDRVSIRLENDVRYGEVRVDHYLLHAKVVDLPSIIESLKTIDTKSFYKTADICQMMICKEEEDQTTTDEEAPSKSKKKDPNKVDKKFLWMHGITPPLKNVRRRRFRKTLKKKFVEQPEIEKEVKRLLRIDNDAVSVKWEIIIDEDEQKAQNPTATDDTSSRYSGFSGIKKEEPNYEQDLIVLKKDPEVVANNPNVEQEIFGEAVSDSEDENINVMDIDESSRISGDDSRLFDSDSQGRDTNVNVNQSSDLVTEFSKDMFINETKHELDVKDEPIGGDGATSSYSYDLYKSKDLATKSAVSSLKDEGDVSGVISEFTDLSRDQVLVRISELQSQLKDLRVQQQQQETELSSIENQALRQRFQDINDRLLQEMYDKENDIQTLQSML